MNPIVMTRAALIILLTAAASCSASASAERKRPAAKRDAVYDYGPRGPNRSYQAGPRTRVYITTRSWLDGGTEVLPGERKFSDYAFPPGTSFARENNNRPLDRQPLNPDFDLGGFTQRIPAPW